MSSVDAGAKRAPLASISEARASIIARVRAIDGEDVAPLAHARGRVLAQELHSPRALPVFDHSAMDGYALALDGGASRFRLRGRVLAGVLPATSLEPGEAARIFTGAPIPSGANAVAMQENVVVAGDEITLTRPAMVGDNIRRAGEDVERGALLVNAGVIIDARHIGLAAAVGFATLPVRRKLRIALISTGDELTQPGADLEPGRIFDSNRPMLASALERPAIDLEDCGVLPDNGDEIAAFLAAAARRCDMVVTTGGASVGDADHLAAAVKQAGGRIDIARVAIRPGKPFMHGRLRGTSIAILPGNPFAAFVAALLFVRPMMEKALGLPIADFAPLVATARFAQTRPAGRVEFLPARIVDRGVHGEPVIERLGKGGSARLQPLIAADGLAVINPGPRPVETGEAVGYLPFGAAFSL